MLFLTFSVHFTEVLKCIGTVVTCKYAILLPYHNIFNVILFWFLSYRIWMIDLLSRGCLRSSRSFTREAMNYESQCHS